MPRPAPSPVRVAIVGAGAVSDYHHVPGLRLDPRARLVAACDADPALLERRKQEWGITRTTTDAEALYCASHILVATEQEAADVASRLEAGEDFATLAGELSTDTGSGAQGGDLGCQAPEVYDPAFAEALTAAEVDVPTAPVESQFGWHIILLREDELPTADEARETLTSEAVNEAANTWFTDQFENAEVTVDEEYGTWQATPTPQVVPPTE